MKLRLFVPLLLVLIVAAPGLAFAQTPPPPPPDLPVVMPPITGGVAISRYQVTATVEDQIATTRVEQTFFNSGPLPVEATYFFPIPEQAAIAEFNMVVDGQTVEGRIMPREEARAIYERATGQASSEGLGRAIFEATVPCFTYDFAMSSDYYAALERWMLATGQIAALPERGYWSNELALG